MAGHLLILRMVAPSIATRAALKLGGYVVTEAGFALTWGPKNFDIKCRKGGLKPNATVLVATIRALKMHGGVTKENLGAENVQAVKEGITNLKRHVSNLKKFGVPVTIALNRFTSIQMPKWPQLSKA